MYSKAWADMGAASVVGIDFSQVMLDSARENCKDTTSISFVWADARHTGIAAGSADIVFARALLHHLPDLDAFFAEVNRLLVPGGMCIVQDRTIEDVQAPPSSRHLRGYFFESFPRLLEKEQARRPDDGTVRSAMESSGIHYVKRVPLWEVRRVYSRWAELETDLLGRTGRSLLHELSDGELGQLVCEIKERLTGVEPIVEEDRWTIWIGEKG